jgi:hypothetical protein
MVVRLIGMEVGLINALIYSVKKTVCKKKLKQNFLKLISIKLLIWQHMKNNIKKLLSLKYY